MKRQVRRNVFETNSSSMHSLVIKRKVFTLQMKKPGMAFMSIKMEYLI